MEAGIIGVISMRIRTCSIIQVGLGMQIATELLPFDILSTAINILVKRDRLLLVFIVC